MGDLQSKECCVCDLQSKGAVWVIFNPRTPMCAFSLDTERQRKILLYTYSCTARAEEPRRGPSVIGVRRTQNHRDGTSLYIKYTTLTEQLCSLLLCQ